MRHAAREKRFGGNTGSHYDQGMSLPDFPLRTARLVLRPYTAEDFDDVYDLHSRPDVTRYLLFDVRGRAQVREALAERIEAGQPGRPGERLLLALAVVLPQAGRVIGD